MKPPLSALGRLLNEISWEGNARKYRHGGRGFENVLTLEVFQALDFLPRAEFLGRIIQSANGGSPATLKLLAEQVEDLTFSFLDGDIDLTKHRSKGKAQLCVQADGILASRDVYCMLEAKRLKRGAFQPEQLAREFLAVIQEAEGRSGLLLLLLPKEPPVCVSGHGRLPLSEAVKRWLPRVLERADSNFAPLDELHSKIDSMVAFTTWARISKEVKAAITKFSGADDSVRRSIFRLSQAVLDAIDSHA
jgi:hypothetical protein